MSVLIRDAVASDRDVCLAINEACMPEVGDMDSEKFDYFLGVSPFFKAAEVDGTVVGMLVGLVEGIASYPSKNYAWFRNRHAAFAYIDRIALLESGRGRGIGVQFYEEFEAWARQQGKPVMSCEVNTVPDNPRSHRFHTIYGFVEVGRQQPYGGDEEVAMYDKVLI